jgi:hypothetical protein
MSGLGKINLATLLLGAALFGPTSGARADFALPMPTLPAPAEPSMPVPNNPNGPGIPGVPAAIAIPGPSPVSVSPIGGTLGYSPGQQTAITITTAPPAPVVAPPPKAATAIGAPSDVTFGRPARASLLSGRQGHTTTK